MNWLDYFRKWASRYEKEVENYGYDPRKLIKPFIPLIGKRNRCLDVGCGTGKSLQALRGICREVMGVEPVEKMARQAEEKGFRVLRIRGEELERVKEKFDLITFFASIDYMNVERVARGVKRALETDGVIFLTVEPENLNRVKNAFEKNGFEPVKSIAKKAYEGQRYVCILLKRRTLINETEYEKT